MGFCLAIELPREKETPKFLVFHEQANDGTSSTQNCHPSVYFFFFYQSKINIVYVIVYWQEKTLDLQLDLYYNDGKQPASVQKIEFCASPLCASTLKFRGTFLSR